MKSEKMPVWVLRTVAVLAILGGLTAAMYPFISNYLFDHRSDSLITTYEAEVDAEDDSEKERLLQAARDYNARLTESTVELTDPFIAREAEDPEEYYSILAFSDTGIMGYIDIPIIDVYLPLYHGTEAKTLEAGIGHLEGTSFPVGGESTHAVLTGHTGLSSARLFTDLITLQENDYFFIHVLGDIYTYKVDQILVVEPDDTAALRITSGMDYVTLITCTPYGINSHRLLVRGVRVPDDEGLAILYPDSGIDAGDAAAELAETREQQHQANTSVWMRQYRMAVIAGISGTASAAILLIGIKLWKKRKRGEKRHETGS